MPSTFRIAVCSIDNKKSVEQDCVDYIGEAARRGADLVLLPEEPDIIAANARGESTPTPIPEENHSLYKAIREAAARHKIGVIASLSFKAGPTRANTGFLLGRDGKRIGVYRKQHPAPGEEEIDSTPLDGGDPLPVFDFEGVRLGIAICMDIHFPEMFRIYALKHADLFCVPTMYMDYTGDMLESIEKARAIDNQCYFALSRYIGLPYLAGQSMGYAKVIAPDGRVISSTGHQPGIAIAEFDPKWRMPFWGNDHETMRDHYIGRRRPEIYGALVEVNDKESVVA